MEQLLELLTERDEPMTTAALARIDLPSLDHWSQIDASKRGELVKLWQPMELG
jgi:hypothetical protein